jgi:hypothetical protein
MRITRFIAPLTVATIMVLTLSQAAHADLLIEVDKSSRHMSVTVNGEQLYDWAVSTVGAGYDPRTAPSGHSALQLIALRHMLEAKPENLIGDRAYDSDPPNEELHHDGSR